MQAEGKEYIISRIYIANQLEYTTRIILMYFIVKIAFCSIVWLQNQRDQNAERTRGGGLGMGVGRGPGFGGRDDFHEFRVGRIKHERVKVRIEE